MYICIYVYMYICTTRADLRSWRAQAHGPCMYVTSSYTYVTSSYTYVLPEQICVVGKRRRMVHVDFDSLFVPHSSLLEFVALVQVVC